MLETRTDLRQTLAAGTADVIRQRILNLDDGYRPGDRLYPIKLAEELGVSVTPVREALKLLASDGLVEFSPRRGACVTQLSDEDLDDLVAVLECLEVLAVRFNGGKWTEEELARLNESLERCEEAIAAGDTSAYRKHDVEFHHRLVAGGHSPRLLSLYAMTIGQAQVVEIQSPRYPSAMHEALNEHRALVRQLARGDAKRSEQAVSTHWAHSRTRLRRKYGEFIRKSGLIAAS